jgi:large repetitive protein
MNVPVLLWMCAFLGSVIVARAQYQSVEWYDDRTAATGEVTLSAVIDQPSPAIGCGVPVTLTATVLGATELSWKRNGQFIEGATTNTFIANQPGTYTVVAVSLLCQLESAPVEVVLQSPLNAAIQTPQGSMACEGQTVLLQATGGDAQWQWYRDGVLLSDGVNSTYTAGVSGDYVLIGNESSPCSSASEAVHVVINPLPFATLVWEGNPILCAGESLMMVTTTEEHEVVSWYLDETPLSAGGNSFIASLAGEYLASITDTLSGCANSTNPLFLEVLPSQEVTIAAEEAFCEGASEVVAITAGEGVVQWFANGVAVPGATDVVLTIFEGGNYAAEITDANNCAIQSNEVSVNIYPLPDATLTLPEGSLGLCGSDDTLMVVAESGNAYEWFLSDIWIADEASAILEVTEPGDYAVRLTNVYGCVAISEVLNVPFFELPLIELTPSEEVNVCAGQAQLFETIPGIPGQYAWYLNGQIMDGEVSATLEAAASGSYAAEFTDENGCSAHTNSCMLQVLDVSTPVITDGGITTEGQLLLTDIASGHQWYLNGEMIPGATGASLLATQAGYYTCIAIEDICESGVSEPFLVVFGSVSENEAGVLLYPNPANEYAVLETATALNVGYSVYDISGRVVLSGMINNARTRLRVDTLSPGMYRLVLGNGRQKAFSIMR